MQLLANSIYIADCVLFILHDRVYIGIIIYYMFGCRIFQRFNADYQYYTAGRYLGDSDYVAGGTDVSRDAGISCVYI